MPLLERAAKLSPATATHHLNLGEAHVLAQQWAAAEASFDALLALEPFNSHAYERRAFVRGELGHALPALADVAKAGTLLFNAS
jgi:regulator of sirC expression with transglutaminase-like and TPR domain